ncbi:MAG: hypothetical protein IPG53_08005 [Ignavibacteriales bacterium]|nr:hypothetical protein [Ignavibacteriales bacterium]
MSKRISILFLFLALFAIPNFAQETFTNSEAKVSVTPLPVGCMKQKVTQLLLPPLKVDLQFILMLLALTILEQHFAEVDKMLAAQVSNLQLAEGQVVDVNGMGGIVVEGTADGILLAIGIIDTPVAGKSLMVGAWATPETLQKYAADVQSILHSISAAH